MLPWPRRRSSVVRKEPRGETHRLTFKKDFEWLTVKKELPLFVGWAPLEMSCPGVSWLLWDLLIPSPACPPQGSSVGGPHFWWEILLVMLPPSCCQHCYLCEKVLTVLCTPDLTVVLLRNELWIKIWNSDVRESGWWECVCVCMDSVGCWIHLKLHFFPPGDYSEDPKNWSVKIWFYICVNKGTPILESHSLSHNRFPHKKLWYKMTS